MLHLLTCGKWSTYKHLEWSCFSEICVEFSQSTLKATNGTSLNNRNWCHRSRSHLETEPVQVPVVHQLPRLCRSLVAQVLDQPVTLWAACWLAHHQEGRAHLDKLHVDSLQQWSSPWRLKYTKYIQYIIYTQAMVMHYLAIVGGEVDEGFLWKTWGQSGHAEPLIRATDTDRHLKRYSYCQTFDYYISIFL